MIRSTFLFAVALTLSLSTTASMAETQLSYKDLPAEVGQIAKSLQIECKDADEGDGTQGNIDRTIDVYRLGNGKRLAIFDPKRICTFKGNSVCSTDGCDVYAYVEKAPGSWVAGLKQTILGDLLIEDSRGTTPLKIVLNLRGGNPPCKRDPQSTCIFELTWKGADFGWKQLR